MVGRIIFSLLLCATIFALFNLASGQKQVIAANATTVLDLHHTTQVRCKILSNKERVDHWELNGKTLVSDSKPYNVTDDGQLLLIFKSDYKHEGTYRCVASNGQYRDQLVLARPNLKLSEGANVRLNFVSAYVARGQNASILCSSSSTSRVSNLSLSWWHDDAKVQSDQMRFTEEGVWLQIQNLTEQQAGRYVCNGTNAVGSDRAELLLRVHHPYNYVWPLTGILLQLFILGSCIACCPEKKKRRPHAE